MDTNLIIRALTPPAVYMLRDKLLSTRARWEHLPDWPLAENGLYDSNSTSEILSNAARIPSVTLTGPLSKVLTHHNWILQFWIAALLAKQEFGKMSILDFGGCIGDYYDLAQALMPGEHIEFHVLDLPKVIEIGAKLRPHVTFHTDIETVPTTINLITAISSLHYIEDWRTTLRQLADLHAGYILMNRMPLIDNPSTYPVMQKTKMSKNPAWVFNRSDLIEAATNSGYSLVREFLNDPESPCPKLPGCPTIGGFLFRSTPVDTTAHST